MGNGTKHWYDLNPSRLEMEKIAMSKLYPKFELMTLEDGALRWSGFIISESKQKYNVGVEYLKTENEDVEPIVIPVLPDVNGLFCGGMVKFREIMTREMCSSIALLNLLSEESNERKLETAASKLKKAQGWYEYYESEKKKVEQEKVAAQEARVRRRQELRKKLLRREAVALRSSDWKSYYLSSNNNEETDSSYSGGEIENIGRNLKKFENKCKSFFELLPDGEQFASEEDINMGKQVSIDLDDTIKIPLKTSIPPSFIIQDFQDFITVKQGQSLCIFHTPLPGGGYYSFNTECLEFPFKAKSLILFYFIKNATNFSLPLIWHSCYGRQTLIISAEDKPKRIYGKEDLDFEKIKALPMGIEILKVEDKRTFLFNYYFWHNWTGYVKCKVLITSCSDSTRLDQCNINIEETHDVLYRYNCHVMF